MCCCFEFNESLCFNSNVWLVDPVWAKVMFHPYGKRRVPVSCDTRYKFKCYFGSFQFFFINLQTEAAIRDFISSSQRALNMGRCCVKNRVCVLVSWGEFYTLSAIC